MSKKINIGL